MRPRVLAVLGVLAVLAPARSFAQDCLPTDTRLCLQDGRFQVEVAWTVPGFGEGPGHAAPLTNDTGTFWFFDNSNVELVLKVLDGRPVNGHFWVYYGGLSDVAYTVTVTDVATGVRKIYENPAGRLASRADTEAFAAPVKLSPVPGGHPGLLPPSPLLRQGSELPVNLTTRGIQSDSSVAIGADGGFLVVWWDESQDYVIRGRLFDAGGQPRGGEMTVSDAPYAFTPQAAASPTGEYMVVWTQDNKVHARVYGQDGQTLAAPFRIGSDANGPQVLPAAAAGADGNFLVAWRDNTRTRTQLFGPRGNPLGPETEIDVTGYDLHLAASPAGGYALAWMEEAPGYLQADVWARRLDALGRPLGPVLGVSASGFSRQLGYKYHPTPVFHPGGGFSVLWTNYVYASTGLGTTGLFARRFDASGQASGVVALQLDPDIVPSTPAAVALRADETLGVWNQGGGSEDPEGGIVGQVFDGSWIPRSAPARINTYTADQQTDPALALDSQGNLVATWSSGVDPLPITPPGDWGEGTQDGHFYGIFGQRFTLQSCAAYPTQLCLGGRFQVEVFFTDPRTGEPGTAYPISLTGDTGAFWFFGEDNVELVVKVLDGRTVNGRFWVYYGALSDVAYTVSVTDTVTGERKTYDNPRGRLESRADIDAF